MGSLALRVLHVHATDLESAMTAFWLGFAVIIGLLLPWHLFAPIDSLATAAVCTLGLAGLLGSGWRFAPRALNSLRAEGRRGAAALIAFLVFSVWLADVSVGQTQLYDAGFYHIGAIRWFETYPVVRGLGNLHGRFAFNNSYFLFFGLFDVGPWWHRSEHLVGGLLLLVTTAQVARYLYKGLCARGSLERHELVGLLFLLPLSALWFIGAHNTSTDIPDFLLGALVGIRLFRLVFYDRRHSELAVDAIVVIVLSAVGVTIKLSFVVFGGAASLLALGWLLRSRLPAGGQARSPSLVWGVAFAALVLAAWMYHGVLLSGYVAYPSSAVGFDVPWKVPTVLADAEARGIQAFGRDPLGVPVRVLANWDWVGPWAARLLAQRLNVLIPLGVFVMGLILWLARAGRSHVPRHAGALLLLPPLASLVYWFFASPDIRYAGSALWLVAAGMAALAIRPESDRLLMNSTVALVCFGALLGVIVTGNSLGHIAYGGPDHGLEPLPKVPVEVFVTDSGLRVNVPVGTLQCWDAPLPCTHFRRPGLRLIEPGSLAGGFELAGPP